MSTMVWDETGARYYETGVSKGIFFPIDGSAGVPWNGLVSVALDPSGGEAEHYYYDGIKYMDRVLAEDFQATVQAISTPREFDASEGVQEVQFGMRTHFNKRDKFNMAWRTEIGSDEGQDVAYKWHIVYNCLVQPSGRNYQTITDTPSMDVRSFVITATPACGRHSYFTFDSRDGDFSDLEAQLLTGVLPKCWELKDLVGAAGGGGGGGTGGDPDAGCSSLLEDVESYVHGQVLSETKTGDDNEVYVRGLVNNGLDIVELPAVGAFAANDSAASEVGTGDILADDDDATYITSADGDLGYTVGLPPLVGYVEGAALELHIRASITGGVSEDDPDNLDADMQVHISTDAGGDDTIGGFSDGADEGMGFSLSAVDGSILDYVVPLSMDAWVDSTVVDVVTALQAGAYLNVVGASNNNFDTTPEVRVYEAKIVMLNDTDPDKWLRPDSTDDAYAQISMDIFDGTHTDNSYEASVTDYIDFKVIEVPFNAAAEDNDASVILATDFDGAYLFEAKIEHGTIGDFPSIKWFWGSSSVSLWNEELITNRWYRLTLDWSWEHYNIKIVERESGLVLHDEGADHTDNPWTQFKSYAHRIGDDTRSFEVAIDNARMQVHCNDEQPPPPPEPIIIDLPAWEVGDFDSNNLSTPSTATEMELPDAFAQDHFGVGYYAEAPVTGATQNIYMPTTPDGYELSHATYVVIAWRDTTETLLSPGSWSPDTPEPTTQPFLMIDSSFSPVDNKTLDPIPVGAYAGETVWQGNDIYGVTHNVPANRLWLQRTGSGHQHIAYLAVRLMYTAI